jgi:hypothetical protein
MKLDLIKEQIVSITQHNKLKSKWHYGWVEPGKDTILYGAITVNQWNGKYGSMFKGSYETKEEWEADGYIEYEPKGGLYYKPHLVIATADGVNHTRSFDTVEAMESWRADHLYGMNLIEIK